MKFKMTSMMRLTAKILLLISIMFKMLFVENHCRFLTQVILGARWIPYGSH